MRRLSGWLLGLLICLSCDNKQSTVERSNEEIGDTSSKVEQPKPQNGDDFLIVPGTRVGAINELSSIKDLRELFGDSTIITRKVDQGEGTFQNATVLYPGTKNEVEIFWKDVAQLDRPALVRIQHAGSAWHTENGIRIGTSISRLVELNRKTFQITGCCYDAPFTIINWNDGALNNIMREKITIRLQPTNNTDQLKAKIVGDKAYAVSDPLIVESDMKVSSFLIRF